MQGSLPACERYTRLLRLDDLLLHEHGLIFSLGRRSALFCELPPFCHRRQFFFCVLALQVADGVHAL